MTAMAPQFAYIMNKKLLPDSNVLRIHIYSTHHERKSCLHDGTVSAHTDKYRLVGIPPSGHGSPDVGFSKHIKRKEW